MILRKLFLAIGFIIVTLIACQSIRVNQTDKPSLNENNISYQNTIKPIMNNYCITCHSGDDPAAGFALTTYKDVRFQAEKGELIHRINFKADPMPQGGLMPKKYREVIKLWAENGFNNNSEAKNNEPMNTSSNDSILHSTIEPIDINTEGFNFFNLMQGHWVGEMFIMGQKYDWFSFDYRPISPSHIHGIFEGGTMGNLFTSFFITNFNGKRTIMARNGGILNGIYRTSYFVLDKVELSKTRNYFRLVDAYGGKDIMWMELEFIDDKLKFNSYTSRLGLSGKPKLHMKFEANKRHIAISNSVAEQLGYPQNIVEFDFVDGFPSPNWGNEYPYISSSTYIHQDKGEDLLTLAKLAGDPYTIGDIPHLSQLKVEMLKNEQIKDKKIILYLSKEPLTDEKGHALFEYGYIKQSVFDGVFLFPEISSNQTEFTFTYLHPGDYYLTAVADMDKSGYISKGDITSKSLFVSVKPSSMQNIKISDITIENK